MSGSADSLKACAKTVERYPYDFGRFMRLVWRLLYTARGCHHQRGDVSANEISELKKGIELSMGKAINSVTTLLLVLMANAWAVDDGAQQFMKHAAADSIAEIEIAELALERASSNAVKTLANHIKQDHQQAQSQLAAIATQKGVELPTDTAKKAEREKERLSALQGDEFDRAYVRAMIVNHEKDIKAFERQARSGDDAQLKAFAAQTLPTLRQHLDHAKQVRKDLQAHR